MKIDFHVHALLSKRFKFKPVDIDLITLQAKKNLLHGLALTEHIESPRFLEIYDFVAKHRISWGISEINNMLIIHGAEIAVKECYHVLFLADFSEIAKLDESIGIRYNEQSLSSLRSNISRGLFVIAHPLRGNRSVRIEDLHYFDAIELNLISYKDDDNVLKLSEEYSIPIIAGSDAHFYPQVGARSSVLPIKNFEFDDIKKSISRNEVEVTDIDGAKVVTKFASKYKSEMKKIKNL